MPNRSIFWISGWSILPDELAAAAREMLPDFAHRAVAPGPDAVCAALRSDATILGGFSFGAHLLLHANDPRPRYLLAPFADLKSEAGLGGAVATTQLRQQLRWFKRDPQAAVVDFRGRISAAPHSAGALPDPEVMAWGLGQMLLPGHAPAGFPPGSITVAGNRDPLLATNVLASIIPGLHIVDAGHQLHPLLAEVARLLQNQGAP